MSMTAAAEEIWRYLVIRKFYVDKSEVVGLVRDALRAHANAALELASSRIKSHRVIESERDDIRETVETVRDQFAAAVLALREEDSP